MWSGVHANIPALGDANHEAGTSSRSIGLTRAQAPPRHPHTSRRPTDPPADDTASAERPRPRWREVIMAGAGGRLLRRRLRSRGRRRGRGGTAPSPTSTSSSTSPSPAARSSSTRQANAAPHYLPPDPLLASFLPGPPTRPVLPAAEFPSRPES